MRGAWEVGGRLVGKVVKVEAGWGCGNGAVERAGGAMVEGLALTFATHKVTRVQKRTGGAQEGSVRRTKADMGWEKRPPHPPVRGILCTCTPPLPPPDVRTFVVVLVCNEHTATCNIHRERHRRVEQR